MTARDALIAAGENLDAALTAYRGCSPANRSARLRELETAHDLFAHALARACDPDQAANPADDLLHLGREVERASIYAVNGGRLSRVPITWPSLLGGAAARWVQAGCPAERLVYIDTLVLRVCDRAWADANGEPDQRPARLINLIRATARSLGIAEDAQSALSPEKEGAWTSHSADAFRYLAMAWQELRGAPKPAPSELRGVSGMTWNELMEAQPATRRRI